MNTRRKRDTATITEETLVEPTQSQDEGPVSAKAPVTIEPEPVADTNGTVEPIEAVSVPIESPRRKGRGRKMEPPPQEMAPALLPTPPAAAPEADRNGSQTNSFLADLKAELRQVVESCREVREELQKAREEVQNTNAELEGITARSLAVKQELVAMQAPLMGLGQGIEGAREVMEGWPEIREQFREARQEVHSASDEFTEIKTRALALKQQFLALEGPLQALQQEAQTTTEALHDQSREVSARFLSIHQDCQEMERKVREVRNELERPQPPSPAPEPPPLPPIPAPDETVAAERVGEHPAVHEPMLALDAPEAPSQGNKHLGVTVDPDATVVDVLPETPAERAGLHPGDVIVGVDGKAVATSEELRSAINEAEAGHDVVLTVAREQEMELVTAQFEKTTGSP